MKPCDRTVVSEAICESVVPDVYPDPPRAMASEAMDPSPKVVAETDTTWNHAPLPPLPLIFRRSPMRYLLPADAILAAVTAPRASTLVTRTLAPDPVIRRVIGVARENVSDTVSAR